MPMERPEEGPSESVNLILPQTNPCSFTASATIPSDPNVSGSIAPASSSIPSRPRWPTIDGPLGLSERDSFFYARRFFRCGFLLLPWLWAVNCFYFWPVLRHKSSFPQLYRYVAGSAIGFLVFTAALASWALTFSIGGEHLFGPVWDELVMYNVAEKYGLTGWI